MGSAPSGPPKAGQICQLRSVNHLSSRCLSQRKNLHYNQAWTQMKRHFKPRIAQLIQSQLLLTSKKEKHWNQDWLSYLTNNLCECGWITGITLNRENSKHKTRSLRCIFIIGWKEDLNQNTSFFSHHKLISIQGNSYMMTYTYLGNGNLSMRGHVYLLCKWQGVDSLYKLT